MTSPSFHQLRQAGAPPLTSGPLTLFACGALSGAPSWWSPDMDIGPMEAAWIESMMQDQEEQHRELQTGEDRASRLLDGSCDGCQEPCTLPLVEVAGEALCPGCLEASGIDYADAVERALAPGRLSDEGT